MSRSSATINNQTPLRTAANQLLRELPVDNINPHCTCILCQSTQSTTNGQLSHSLNNYTTVTPDKAKVLPLGDLRIDPLLSGERWDNPRTITYSFLTSDAANSYYGGETVTPLSQAIISNIREIIKNVIGPLISVNFVEVADSASSYGQIRYMFSDGPEYAYAYYPSAIDPMGGDVHLSSDYEFDPAREFSGSPGSYGYMTLIHETFHALGLKHPGDYNGDGSGDPPFLPYPEDNTTNTVMTYNTAVGNLAATAMPYDIQALQHLYGAKAHQAGNTTYFFKSVYGYTSKEQAVGSSETPMKLAIWDSGGTDTLDFSALPSNASGYRFNLQAGRINTTQYAYNSTSYQARGDTSGTSYQTSTNGTAIAYNTVIEHAKGSSSNDIIIGNSVVNTLKGRAGNDSLTGGDSNDQLSGGAGIDTVYESANVNFTLTNTSLIGLGTDTLYKIERANLDGGSGNNTLDASGFTLGKVKLRGNPGNDTLLGSNGNDVLIGGRGNDTLTSGLGVDNLDGGAGDDILNSGLGVDDDVDGGAGSDLLILDYSVGDTGSGVSMSIYDRHLEGASGFSSRYTTSSDSYLDKVYFTGINHFKITGTSKADDLSGWNGDDILAGGAGNDRLTGGNGNDQFLYNTNAAFSKDAMGIDVIDDFTENLDKIVLGKTTFTSLNSASGVGFDVAEEFQIVTSDVAAETSSGEIVYNSTNNNLFYNSNGTAVGFGSGDLFATLTGVFSLAATDLIIQA